MDSHLNIHLIAACGTGMGSLACMLKEMGHTVTGSDKNVYPPMSDFLLENKIFLNEGFNVANLSYGPDFVIIGNAVRRDNPEARFVIENKIPYMSMPQAVNRFVVQGKKIILVTGTHGKTTTSSIMAHILLSVGKDPSFIIGGILKNYDAGFRIGNGDYIVIEGDEYDTAFFDKRAKFMHYDPEIAIITGVEFDHGDIFTDLGQIKSVFSIFVDKIAPFSHIIACRDNEDLVQILSSARCSIETYGKSSKGASGWSIVNRGIHNCKTLAEVIGPSTDYFIETSLMGDHNLNNFLACAVVAKKLGIESIDIQRAMLLFAGVKRRQEIRGIKSGITVMDDFAHHPTAVRETIEAVKPFYSNGRLIVVFEPRTNTSMRNFFQNIYPQAFDRADMVCICRPSIKKNIPEEERFSVTRLVSDINERGGNAHCFETVEEILDFLPARLKLNDLVLIMSNGGFDDIHSRLLAKIK